MACGNAVVIERGTEGFVERMRPVPLLDRSSRYLTLKNDL